MSAATAKKIENPLLSRYPSQPALPASQPLRQSIKPLEPATHHNMLITSSNPPPPRRSYDDGLIFPLSADLKPAITDNGAAMVTTPPMYDTSGCWVRVIGIATDDQLNDAMKHLSTYGAIKHRYGNVSPTSNIIVVQYSSQFEAMAAAASTFIQLTPYFYLAVQRLDDADPVLHRLIANPSDSIFGVARKAEEKKEIAIDETDIFLCAPPKKEFTERGFIESLLCWFLSIKD
ncbi:hypothetical protein FisN_25Hh005 [Fistulifera solaris]|jgi:hypothetical protein|uniref:RRM Nup35-type domain-containing protein n=1 Tax=Fistulifera solaris TaxID=1519565 RepID=A0A1Z5JW31_FISSO|nr:hypothetical protein FisN_25Hh005 [Fistulifera solaris]|eukprot:GAX18032.1 hypothetical protein FisN_25Hh005 [Fistulifera solaris]